jgi:hypothetical protein
VKRRCACTRTWCWRFRKEALYIGECRKTATRFRNHEKFGSASRLGANELHIFYGGRKDDRLEVETDLRRAHETPLNEQPTPARQFGLGVLGSFGAPASIPPPPYNSLGVGAVCPPKDFLGGVLGTFGAPASIPPPPYNSLGLGGVAPSTDFLGGVLGTFGAWKRP